MAGVSGVVLLEFAWPQLVRLLPGCGFRRMTGLYCPGCGGTRCTDHLLHGDLPGALAMNPLVVFLFSVAAAVLGIAVVREWQGRRDALPQIPAWLAWLVTGCVITFALTRNLPWWPFTLLVPH